MKKIVLILALSVSFLSCSLGDDGDANSVGDFYLEYVPIESVSMPVEFTFGQTYTIEYTYYQESTCHLFRDLFYDFDGTFDTILLSNTVLVNNGQCIDLQDELITRTFNFEVNRTETYHFRFWQGEDTNGIDTYLEIEVPVVQ